jgi:hypothetical protein
MSPRTNRRATTQETHMPTSFADPRRLRRREPGGGVGAHPAVRIASGRVSGARRPGTERGPVAFAQSRRKYTGPQHASVGVLNAARTWSQRVRSPTA